VLDFLVRQSAGSNFLATRNYYRVPWSCHEDATVGSGAHVAVGCESGEVREAPDRIASKHTSTLLTHLRAEEFGFLIFRSALILLTRNLQLKLLEKFIISTQTFTTCKSNLSKTNQK